MKMYRAIALLTAFLAAVPIVALANTVGEAPKEAEQVEPLDAGDKAPEAVLKNVDGSDFDLHAALKEKPIVLIFYRGSWCPYCNTHLAAMQKVESELTVLGYEIVAVSPDKPENLTSSVDKGKLTYRLVSDASMKLARDFGVAFEVDEATRERYKGFKIDLEKASGESHWQLPVPAVYIIDQTATIRFRHFDPDYKVRMKPEDVVAAAKEALKSS